MSRASTTSGGVIRTRGQPCTAAAANSDLATALWLRRFREAKQTTQAETPTRGASGASSPG
eukprot:CAMPEP_0175081364 /NCGR_PEP_ID=MMETSP0052_2-20121109/26097_1 /TAXON_ID=51329 ORGANISM="Polytomella parva, Strain SAG 63-3" /NCGR_SAMPLE_ID=MMETSP0052_2 /ASSEMBLY_ACC=CAM_ASM_000194 /LENGTH=60 /DNA_ID=CAMNT_0016352317 /DNA_START=96 /DNA_END=278 /DNA_ORIENTATION=-